MTKMPFAFQYCSATRVLFVPVGRLCRQNTQRSVAIWNFETYLLISNFARYRAPEQGQDHATENRPNDALAAAQLAVCVGVIFLLFGGLFVAACLAMLGQGANAPAAAKVGTTVQIVTTVIFALVALVGIFLIWLGLRRGTVASASPDEHAGRVHPSTGVHPP